MAPRGGEAVPVPFLSPRAMGTAPVVERVDSLGMSVVPMTTHDFRRWGISVLRPLADKDGNPILLRQEVASAISDLESSVGFLGLPLRPRIQWVNKCLDVLRALIVTCAIRSFEQARRGGSVLEGPLPFWTEGRWWDTWKRLA